jgi:hypothetical protein
MYKENQVNHEDQSNNNDDEVLELIYQIIDDGQIINLKEKREKETILAQKIINHDNLTKYDSNENDKDELNDNDEEYQAYLNFKKKINDIGLKTLLKKVNTPDINHQISVYTHENDLLSQSMLLSIVACIKPLYTMGVNISKENTEDENEKLQIMKNYVRDHFEKIKLEIISRYNDNRVHKISVSKSTDEVLQQNLYYFNEILINNFLIWINLGFENSAAYAEDYKLIDERLANHIDNFMNKYLDEIFSKISF